jgi:hypothetical protein
VIDNAVVAYVDDETKKNLDAVVKAVMHKVPRCLAHGIAMQLLEEVFRQYELAEMQAEDATTAAEEKATANAWKMLAAAVDAASPGK